MVSLARSNRAHDKAVINSFVDHVSAERDVPLSVTRWPDEEERRRRDIDALACGPGIALAIEHTSADRLAGQREDDSRFCQEIEPLRERVACRLAGAIQGSAQLVVPHHALQKGMDWRMIATLLEDWTVASLPSLPWGSSRHRIAGVPFEFRISKRLSSDSRFSVGRDFREEEAQDFPDRLARLVETKIAKLQAYRAAGCISALLIEDSDIALNCPALINQALDRAWRRWSGVCYSGPGSPGMLPATGHSECGA
jgi:hypothetical protein